MTNFLKNAISHDEKKSRNYFNSLLLKLKASSSFEKKTVGVKEKLRSINIKEERNDKTEILNVGRHYSKTRTVGFKPAFFAENLLRILDITLC